MVTIYICLRIKQKKGPWNFQLSGCSRTWHIHIYPNLRLLSWMVFL